MSTDIRPKILIVDDEPRNIRLLKGILYAEPYHLLTATSGPEALRIIQEHNPDLILLDIMMPGMSGYDVCQQVKSMPAYRMIPVVMVTALYEVSDRIQAIEAGADDFLSKPVDATELLVRVRSLVRVRQLYVEVERITAERLRFMAGVAHDIRSPLNALTLNLEMIAGNLPENEQVQDIWSRVPPCIDRIQMLASDIMNYYKIEAGQFEFEIGLHQAHDVVQHVLDIAQPIADEKHIGLLAGSVDIVTAYMDHGSIVQVLLNLVTNAISYTPADGSVILNVYDLAHGHYQLPLNHYPPVLALPVEGVVFEVQDTGQGIAMQDFNRVFSEFDRLKADQDGVGLGLPVSQRLVRLHDGDIWFASIVGKGSTFAFYLPTQHSAG